MDYKSIQRLVNAEGLQILWSMNNTNMNKIPSTIIFLLSTLFLPGQRDTLNKFNAKGNRQGYWICYLDNKFKVTDSLKGIYVGFDLYDNGQNLTQLGRQGNLGVEKIIDSLSLNPNKTDKCKLLDGKILFYNKAGDLLNKEVFSQGHPVKFTSYCYYDNHLESKGDYKEIVDFTKLYNGIKGTYYYESKSCMNGRSVKYYFRKGRKKWKAFRIEE
jgi:hypothetical protein